MPDNRTHWNRRTQSLRTRGENEIGPAEQAETAGARDRLAAAMHAELSEEDAVSADPDHVH